MLGETLRFCLNHPQMLLVQALEHLGLVCVAVFLATLVGVPLGVLIIRHTVLAHWVLWGATVVMTIPMVALLTLMVPLLDSLGAGLGYGPALLGVVCYSLLPIIRNTATALGGVAPALRECATGLGMSARERLRFVEIPLAIPGIMAGIRVAAVFNVGTVAVAAYLGGGGLGVLVARGLAQDDPRQLLAGAFLLGCLAVVMDLLLGRLQQRLTPVGMRAFQEGKR